MNHKLRLKWTLILIFGLYISSGNVKCKSFRSDGLQRRPRYLMRIVLILFSQGFAPIVCFCIQQLK